MLGTLLLAVAVVAVHGDQLTTNVNPCSFFSGPLPLHVYVDGCVDLPCQVNPGQDVVLNLVFQAPRTTKTMRSSASAFLIPVIPITPDPGPAGLTCNTLTNSYCPIMEGEILRSRSVVPLPPILPTLTVPVEFRVLDDNDDPFVCVRLNVAITQN